MKFSKVVVVPKLSMVQIDMHRYGLNEVDLESKYKRDGKDVNRIFESHYKQMKSVDILKKRFPNTIYQREAFNHGVADEADLVIAAGGDEHFKYISHYIKSTPILGLNTDPERSRGELLENNIENKLEKLEKNEFEIKDETRIEALVNEIPFLPGISIYAIGRSDPFGNFRYRIEFKGKHDEHRITSGLIVYTGNGMTDWPKGAGRYLENVERLNPTERKIGWIVREPHDDYELMSGVIQEGEYLYIVCYKDNSTISADGIGEHIKPVESGYRIRFKISSTPLRHVRIDKIW
jgi:hypothetical protein